MRTPSIQLQPLSLALGLAFGLVCFFSMGQIGVPVNSWGPPKKNIVNLWEPGPITIPPGASLNVYDVPADQWLVVTGVGLSASYPFAWVEDLNGVITVKGTNAGLFPQATSAPIGWTFRPGSKVVLQSLEMTYTSNIYNRSLLGYLARE